MFTDFVALCSSKLDLFTGSCSLGHKPQKHQGHLLKTVEHSPHRGETKFALKTTLGCGSGLLAELIPSQSEILPGPNVCTMPVAQHELHSKAACLLLLGVILAVGLLEGKINGHFKIRL